MTLTDLEREVLRVVASGGDPWNGRTSDTRTVSQALQRLKRKGALVGRGRACRLTDAGQAILELPTLLALATQLREMNEHFDGPGGVSLALEDFDGTGREWRVGGYEYNEHERTYGYEELPGDGKRFDPTAAAKRLLKAAHDGCSGTRATK